ncbi:MAG: dihydroorotate dehydrogenase electron transfer subunit [Candidatus Nezhaarchaeales archaeon]
MVGFKVVKVEEVIRETPSIKTLLFTDEEIAKSAVPGQFLMVWVPGVDEVPMSLSFIGIKGRIGISVAKVGEATEALHACRPGTLIGIRGPLGKGFTLTGGKVLVVGGGVGVAALAPLIEGLVALNASLTVIIGARTSRELLFYDRLRKVLKGANHNLMITTDDGSAGVKGLASALAVKVLAEGRYNQIYACGPEPMLKDLLNASAHYKVTAQMSLERLIKCGVGLCGACAINGYRVCSDGPVFNSQTLLKLKDFGRTARDATGRPIDITKAFRRHKLSSEG